jgi:hypothetical protein
MRKSLQFALAGGSMFIFSSTAIAQDARKSQSALRDPTADCPRVRATLGITLNNLARTGFSAHMGRASSCAVHIGGDARPPTVPQSPTERSQFGDSASAAIVAAR